MSKYVNGAVHLQEIYRWRDYNLNKDVLFENSLYSSNLENLWSDYIVDTCDQLPSFYAKPWSFISATSF